MKYFPIILFALAWVLPDPVQAGEAAMVPPLPPLPPLLEPAIPAFPGDGRPHLSAYRKIIFEPSRPHLSEIWR